jgi:hypothetical protein
LLKENLSLWKEEEGDQNAVEDLWASSFDVKYPSTIFFLNFYAHTIQISL